LAIFALLLFFLGLFCLMTDGPTNFLKSASVFFLIIFPSLMLSGGIILIRVGDIRFEWDEQAISRRGWFKRPITLAWSEVTDLNITTHKNQPVYLLHNGRGETFRIDFGAIADDRGLQGWLQQKLSPLFRQATGCAELQLPFTSFWGQVGGRNSATMILEEDRIIQQVRNEEVVVHYHEIKTVISQMVNNSDSNRITRYILWDDSSARLAFVSSFFNATQILFFLRHRLKNAVWVDLAQSEPPADTNAAALYHRLRLEIGRKALISLGKMFIACFIVIGLLALYWYHKGKLKHELIQSGISIFFTMLATQVVILKDDLWRGLVSRLAMRRLR
jgi:hypothetical protein